MYIIYIYISYILIISPIMFPWIYDNVPALKYGQITIVQWSKSPIISMFKSRFSRVKPSSTSSNSSWLKQVWLKSCWITIKSSLKRSLVDVEGLRSRCLLSGATPSIDDLLDRQRRAKPRGAASPRPGPFFGDRQGRENGSVYILIDRLLIGVYIMLCYIICYFIFVLFILLSYHIIS